MCDEGEGFPAWYRDAQSCAYANILSHSGVGRIALANHILWHPDYQIYKEPCCVQALWVQLNSSSNYMQDSKIAVLKSNYHVELCLSY